jgi:hypothetical protein
MLSNRHRAWMRRSRDSSGKPGQAMRELPGVIGVTLGEKRIAGQRTGKRAMVVYVDRKRQVGADDLVPRTVTLRGPKGPQIVPTDIVELGGTPRLLSGVRAGDLIRCTDGDFGTSSLAFTKNGTGYVATCAHVVANVVTGVVFQSALQDPATLNLLQLGGVPYISSIRPSRTATEDFALVQTNNLTVDVRMTMGHPEVTASTVHMLADGAWFPYADFVFLRMLSGTVAGGHSGSLVCRGSGGGIVACGVLFGGAPPNYAYVFPIVPMFDRVFANLP